jgi:hypothetical protein
VAVIVLGQLLLCDELVQSIKIDITEDRAGYSSYKVANLFFGARFPCKTIHPKDHMDLLQPNLDLPDKRPQNLTLAMPS